jgi:formylglycine-generating enzyme required for sulfatase activity
MNGTRKSILLAGFLMGVLHLSAALPVVSNVTSSQRAGTKLVDITYTVEDADGDMLKIRLEISDDGGVTYQVPAFSLTGHIGDNITPGAGKKIVWDAKEDWDGEYSDKMRVKVIASDTKGFPGLEWGNEVPPGGFLMGQDGGTEGSGPSRHVNIPWSYWLSKYEIRVDQYAEYLNMALVSGYINRLGTSEVKTLPNKYSGILSNDSLLMIELGDDKDIRWNVNKFEAVQGRANHPVCVSWYGAIAFAQHYGYDLPTEAEWEKAARGPDHDDEGEHRVYPWSDTISSGHANYNAHPFGNKSTPVGYFNGDQTPVGPDTKNAYGLYDIVGNLSEWTRSNDLTVETYPREESLSNSRHSYTAENNYHKSVLRGGDFKKSDGYIAIYKRITATRTYTYNTYRKTNGFRVIRRELE